MKCKTRNTFHIKKMKRYPIWSYLSISAMDAPIISVSWYLYFAQNSLNYSFNSQHCLILGVSVWLGYMADRLFDIRLKEEYQLTSLRHKFCKEHRLKLWIIWFIVLILIVIFSLRELNSDKLFTCFILLANILLYNCLNQYFSRKGFPKEICAAAIFSYGTLIFVEYSIEIDTFINFTIICFLNCLILSHKDKEIDSKMGVRSIMQSYTHRTIAIITLFPLAYFCIIFDSAANPFFIISVFCLIIHCFSDSFNEEYYRLTIESIYTFIPIFFLLL